MPVLSWFTSCESCGNHKGLRYPLIDLTLAAVFAMVAYRFGADIRLLPYLGLGAVLVALSAIDVETHLLPNVIVWPSIWASLFIIFVVSGLVDYEEGINSALIGAAVFGGFIGLSHLAYERGMGRGDVKLAVLLGLFVGWLQPDTLTAVRLVLYTIIIALFGGALGGLAYNAVRRRGRAEIPFGPALAAATIVVVAVSPSLLGT